MTPFAQSMTQVITPAESGCAKLSYVTVDKHTAFMSALRDGWMAASEGQYARLHVNGQLMMTDTQMERKSNHHIRYAEGDVLIAGLGIGLILTSLLPNPAVKSVTIVEKYADVIALVEPQIRGKIQGADKLTCICADIDTWKPVKGTKYDFIYFDIWPTISTDNLPHIAKLHQRFKGVKRAGGYMGSWMHRFLKSERRRYA